MQEQAKAEHRSKHYKMEGKSFGNFQKQLKLCQQNKRNMQELKKITGCKQNFNFYSVH